MSFKGKITVELEIEKFEDGDYTWDHTINVTGIPKDELYHLFEDGLINIDDEVYEHMALMKG